MRLNLILLSFFLALKETLALIRQAQYVRLNCTSFRIFSSCFTSSFLEETKIPVFLVKIPTLHCKLGNRRNIIFSLSFVPMLSSRFKFNLLECLNHPIVTDSFGRGNISSNFCTIINERYDFTSSHMNFFLSSALMRSSMPF